MGAPTVYRWDDDNAPVVEGASGTAIIEMLKACLVDGYGSKAAAGWTMPFDNGLSTKAVFRNNPVTGTGFYLRVDNTGANTNAPELVAYETMSDIDTGVGLFSSTPLYAGASVNVSTTSRPWIVIADDRFFHCMVWTGTTASTFTDMTTAEVTNYFAFGDGISLFADDNYFCVLLANTSSTYVNRCYALAFTEATATPTNNSQKVARNIAGDDAETLFMLNKGGGPHSATTYGGVVTGIDRVVGYEMASRPFANNGVANSIRGWIPGLWHLCHNPSDFECFENVTVGDVDLLAIFHKSYTTEILSAFEISAGFRP